MTRLCITCTTYNYPGLLLNAEVEYPCLSGERRHLPCINFKDSACPAELPRWLSWYSICLEHRRSRVRVPPAGSSSFSLEKKELSSGVVACICLVSITDYSCILYVHEHARQGNATLEDTLFFTHKTMRCLRRDLNPRHTCTVYMYHADALPAELRLRVLIL